VIREPRATTLPGSQRRAGRWKALLPGALALATSAIAAWIWGWQNPPPIVADEGAYLLQARIFADFRWTAPARPLARFFEQMQVYTTPVLASKYPPGHSILLTPGIWIHWPSFVPLLLTGLSAALFFVLARRVAGSPTALLAWAIWVTSLGFRVVATSYLSEVTTLFLWLVVWLSLREWLRTRRTGWLLLTSVGIAWCAITRPLTAIALAIPVAIVVARIAIRRRSFFAPALATVAGALVLAIIPIWNRGTLGSWRSNPYSEYSRIFFPYEKPGLGEDRTAALAPFPPGYGSFDRQYRALHRSHTWRALPATAARRLLRIIGAVTEGRAFLAFFLVVGLFTVGREARFALWTCLLLFLLYLSLAHPPEWIVYYDEAFPAVSLAISAGIVAFISGIARAAASKAPRVATLLSPSFVCAALSAALFLGAVPAMAELRQARRQETGERHAILEFARSAKFRSILFLPCDDRRRDLCDAVQNAPDLTREKVWLVHDQGPADADLIHAAPDRIPLRYDPVRLRIMRLAAP
jgi:hypothetical protein